MSKKYRNRCRDPIFVAQEIQTITKSDNCFPCYVSLLNFKAIKLLNKTRTIQQCTQERELKPKSAITRKRKSIFFGINNGLNIF